MQIRLTAIIPPRLNEKLMKFQLLQGLQDAGRDIRENFEDTTRTWDHKVTFSPSSLTPVVSGGIARVETSTDDLIYKYVSGGTKEHIITPRNAKTLRFPGTFVPKTFPGIVGSGQGYGGPPIQYRQKVLHPGVDPRKFDKEIKDRQKKNFVNHITKAMSLARLASGHAYP